MLSSTPPGPFSGLPKSQSSDKWSYCWLHGLSTLLLPFVLWNFYLLKVGVPPPPSTYCPNGCTLSSYRVSIVEFSGFVLLLFFRLFTFAQTDTHTLATRYGYKTRKLFCGVGRHNKRTAPRIFLYVLCYVIFFFFRSKICPRGAEETSCLLRLCEKRIWVNEINLVLHVYRSVGCEVKVFL